MPNNVRIALLAVAGIVWGFRIDAKGAAPFAAEVHSLASGQPRSKLTTDSFRPPSVTLLTGSGSNQVRRRDIDRSPILRSFDPALKMPNPYLTPQKINLRHPLKW